MKPRPRRGGRLAGGGVLWVEAAGRTHAALGPEMQLRSVRAREQPGASAAGAPAGRRIGNGTKASPGTTRPLLLQPEPSPMTEAVTGLRAADAVWHRVSASEFLRINIRTACANRIKIWDRPRRAISTGFSLRLESKHLRQRPAPASSSGIGARNAGEVQPLRQSGGPSDLRLHSDGHPRWRQRQNA